MYWFSKGWRKCSHLKMYVLAASDDVVYATTRDLMKPSKHVCFGIIVKTISGSKIIKEFLITLYISSNIILPRSIIMSQRQMR